ncbi:MAG TPA: glycosyl hydrolase family 28-related protein, partial [Candidatus Angelobacter sp.]|nr:glycosyl hydrolase family 28-related protein [Candidatus Angelobacter sp.]
MTDRREFLKMSLVGGSALLFRPEFLCGASSAAQAGVADAWDALPQILARIKPPVFPNRDFDITKFGAIGDGKFDCTSAFQKAIAACKSAGGGRVVVPPGEFATGAIHLKSNVNL